MTDTNYDILTKVIKEIFDKRTISNYLFIDKSDLSVHYLPKKNVENKNLVFLGRPFPKENTQNQYFLSKYDENLPYASLKMFASYIWKNNRLDIDLFKNTLYEYILNNFDTTHSMYKTIKDSKLDFYEFLRYTNDIEINDPEKLKVVTEIAFCSASKPRLFNVTDKYLKYLNGATVEERLSFLSSRYIYKPKLFELNYEINHIEEARYLVSDYGPNLKQTPKFNDDIELVKSAICDGDYAHPSSLEFASDRLKDDTHIVLLACSYESSAILYASDRIKNACSVENSVEDLKKLIEKEELAQKLSDDFSGVDSVAKRKIKI